MAIATSSYREEIMPTINALGIDEYVDVIVGREDVEAVKPDPELYLTAVQRLNYSPAHCSYRGFSKWRNRCYECWIGCNN